MVTRTATRVRKRAAREAVVDRSFLLLLLLRRGRDDNRRMSACGYETEASVREDSETGGSENDRSVMNPDLSEAEERGRPLNKAYLAAWLSAVSLSG
jgi:hypothetical protein